MPFLFVDLFRRTGHGQWHCSLSWRLWPLQLISTNNSSSSGWHHCHKCSQVTPIAGLTLQAVDLDLFRVEEVNTKNTMQAEWREHGIGGKFSLKTSTWKFDGDCWKLLFLQCLKLLELYWTVWNLTFFSLYDFQNCTEISPFLGFFNFNCGRITIIKKFIVAQYCSCLLALCMSV